MAKLTDEEVPDGWRVLWCPACLVSLAWTDSISETYDELWAEHLKWAVENVEHNQEKHEKLDRQIRGQEV